MHDNKEKLMAVGRRVLEASKTELYVAMRFLDLALNSLDYEMDLSIRTVGTDSRSIRYNPSYLIQAYREDSLRVNRLYLHMILHCVFRHMFGGDDKALGPVLRYSGHIHHRQHGLPLRARGGPGSETGGL